MKLTISVSDGQLINVDVSESLTLGDLKAYIQAETELEPQHQKLTVDGKLLTSETQTLSELGLKDDDLLVLDVGSISTNEPVPAAATHPPPQSTGGSDRFNLTSEQAERFRTELLGNEVLVKSLKRFRPNITELLANPAAFLEYATTNLRNDMKVEAMAIEMNPEDPENQARILQSIRQEQIDRNYQLAHDITPEAFTRINMLYVKMIVNGHELNAFIDTGAAVSIISPKVAESVGISHLIDKRFHGEAVGVGRLKIEGKIHSVPISFPNSDIALPASFSVIDGLMDFLIGLDLMRRHKCIIDLERHIMVTGGSIEVPFLSDVEVEKIVGDQLGFKDLLDTIPKATTSKATTDSVTKPMTASASSSQTSSARSSAFPEKDIKILVDLGFTRSDAIRALHQCNGNVDVAASLLFQ